MNVERAEPGTAEWADLAAPGDADFPVVPGALAAVYGEPRFMVAICRPPRDAGEATPWAG